MTPHIKWIAIIETLMAGNHLKQHKCHIYKDALKHVNLLRKATTNIYKVTWQTFSPIVWRNIFPKDELGYHQIAHFEKKDINHTISCQVIKAMCHLNTWLSHAFIFKVFFAYNWKERKEEK